MKYDIFAVDDDSMILRLIKQLFKGEEYRVQTFSRGYRALDKIKMEQPDLILLDLSLPDIDGLEICRIIRDNSKLRHIPIIMLTGRVEEEFNGLRTGAVDFIRKPFSGDILRERVKAAMRRKDDILSNEDILEDINVQINIENRSVSVNGEKKEMRKKEFDLLCFLLKNRGKVVSRENILNSVWGYCENVCYKTVDTHINRIRKKLGDAAEPIKSIRGIGYIYNIEEE